MKQFKLKLFVWSICSITFLHSCMTTKTNVGTYRELQGEEYTYAKGKQLWLFWGLIPLGRTDVNTPTDGNCQVITRHNFGDVLIGGITGGILTSHTIKIKAKRPVSAKEVKEEKSKSNIFDKFKKNDNKQ